MALGMNRIDDPLAYLNNSRSLPAAARIAVEIAAILGKWAERRHTRAALRQLTLAQLDDVGLSPRAARREGMKPFWIA